MATLTFSAIMESRSYLSLNELQPLSDENNSHYYNGNEEQHQHWDSHTQDDGQGGRGGALSLWRGERRDSGDSDICEGE